MEPHSEHSPPREKNQDGVSLGMSPALHDLVPVDAAIESVRRLARPVQIETVSLDDAAGRILAEPLFASAPQPLFDNSAMDGYAVRLEALDGDGPWRLPVVDRVAAGDSISAAVSDGAVRIFTGAQVPESCDAVIMQEHVETDGSDIIVRSRPRKGDNIRRTGEDIQPGAKLLEPGVALTPARAALAASVGRPNLEFYRKVVVGMFSTGSELRQPGEKLEPGQIYNSNRFMLRGQLDRPFVETLDLGALPDTPRELARGLQQAAKHADVILTTGGVSVGEEDHMPRLVADAGGELHVLKVAMKPGKPVTVGTLGDAIYVGLPGNPVAAFITFELIARTALELCAGITTPQPAAIAAVSAFDRKRRPIRREYLPARIIAITPEGLPLVDMIGRGSSAALLPMAMADGMAVIDPGPDHVASGERITYIPLPTN